MVMSLRVIDWDSLDPFSSVPSAMTIGVFDGVHRGHAELIRRVVSRGPCPTVVTFRENPKRILSPRHYEGDIFSLEQRLAAFEELGAVRVILIDFSEKFSKIDGWEFIDSLESRGAVVFLAIGANFRCGYRHGTGADLIRQRNDLKDIPTEIIPPVLYGNGSVSSSRIRAAILGGDLDGAGALLGRPLELDLSGLRGLPLVKGTEEGMVFDASSLHRITPADGRYKVFIASQEAVGVYAEITVERRKVFIPFSGELHCSILACPGLRVVFTGFPI
jgi:riboflavin kinase/FMN adenylyltransferase